MSLKFDSRLCSSTAGPSVKSSSFAASRLADIEESPPGLDDSDDGRSEGDDGGQDYGSAEDSESEGEDMEFLQVLGRDKDEWGSPQERRSRHHYEKILGHDRRKEEWGC